MNVPDLGVSLAFPQNAKGTVAYLSEGSKNVIEYIHDEQFKDVQLDDVVSTGDLSS